MVVVVTLRCCCHIGGIGGATMPSWSSCGGGSTAQGMSLLLSRGGGGTTWGMSLLLSRGGGGTTWGTSTSSFIVSLWQWYDQGMLPSSLWLMLPWLHRLHGVVVVTSRHRQGGPGGMVVGTTRMSSLLLSLLWRCGGGMAWGMGTSQKCCQGWRWFG